MTAEPNPSTSPSSPAPKTPPLTVAELAGVLNVSLAWVRKGVLERTLPFTKLGRSVRFTPAQVDQIVEAGERPPVHHGQQGPGNGGQPAPASDGFYPARRRRSPRRPGRIGPTVSCGATGGRSAVLLISIARAMAWAITGSCRLMRPPYTS
jgi:excisionase family DNA binding protein